MSNQPKNVSIQIPYGYTEESLIEALVWQLAKLNAAIKNEEQCPGFMQRKQRREQSQSADFLLQQVGYLKSKQL